LTLNEGRAVEQKQRFYKAVADDLHRRVSLRREDVFISLVDVTKENRSFDNGEAQKRTPMKLQEHMTIDLKERNAPAGMDGENSDTGIKIYLREIRQIPLLTPQEEIDLAARIKKGDREARALMIKANLRLVVKIAHDYANLGLPLLDLVSEGNIGLMKAVERFDPAKGGKLSTYGAWWIRQSIKRALANQSKTIRLPVHWVNKISKMRRVSLQMSEELGREPTDDELAEEIGISSGKVSQLKTVSIRPASLDAPISDDDSTEFGEILGDEGAQTPFELLRDKNLRDEVSDLLEALDDRERVIIFQRFGLDSGKPKTLEEVGNEFGVTRERIRQLQNIALAKLRRALSKKETPR
jgi:RNA polymerase primary sigma factor